MRIELRIELNLIIFVILYQIHFIDNFIIKSCLFSAVEKSMWHLHLTPLRVLVVKWTAACQTFMLSLQPWNFFLKLWVQVASASSQAQQSNPVWHVDGSMLHTWLDLYDWTNSQVSL